MSENGGKTYRPRSLGGPDLITSASALAFHGEARRLSYPSTAGFYDPLSIMCVLDAILHLEHDGDIRPHGMTKLMALEYPQLRWAPITVGRIMSDLAEAAGAANPDLPPIQKQLTHGGHRYWVNVTPANWQWLLDARRQVGLLAERAVEMAHAGITAPRQTFPFDVFDQIEYGEAA